MIIKNIVYNGVDLSDNLAKTNHIIITDCQKDVKLRTQIFNRETYHGANSSNTLAEGRLFTFKGYIWGLNKADRYIGQQILNNVIKPEGLPSEVNTGFYELSWKDDNGTQYKTQAKVYKMPEYNNDVGDELIPFTFELYSESATFKGYIDESVVRTAGWFGGIALPTLLPAQSNHRGNVTAIINDGNFAAPTKVTLTGSIQNPKILNLTNNRWYQLTGITTTSLVIDYTVRPFIIEDEGVDVSGYRVSGSKSIYLEPGENILQILGDNLMIGDDTVTVTVAFNDAYINS